MASTSTSSASLSDEDAKAALAGHRFMRKAERAKCYGARDAFWECMKANGEDVQKCKDSRYGFESSCPPTWVTHFDRKFQYEKFKAELYSKGVEALDKDFGKKNKDEKNK